jgi:hypothetical protein
LPALVLVGAFACDAAATELVLDQVTVRGTDVPSHPVIPGLPGFSGYTVSIEANAPGHIVFAVDAGTNTQDYPHAPVDRNFGLFGPMHQRWFLDDGGPIPSPYHSNNLLDSTFLLTYDAVVMVPRENNNVSPAGIGSPLSDTATVDYGVGDTMRTIAGVSQTHFHDLPLAYLVIPDGHQVLFRGQVVTGPDFSRDGPTDSIISFSVGRVPEPGSAVVLGTLAMVSLARRRAR